jgi:formate-dependent nitrite reductase membrane component NrfD
LLFFGLVIWSRQVAFVLIFCGFAASGFLKWLYYRVVNRGQSAVDEAEAAALE